jgi:hypothetical protein
MALLLAVRQNQRSSSGWLQRHLFRNVGTVRDHLTFVPATVPSGAATTQATFRINAAAVAAFTLPVKVLAIEAGNSKTVSYDSATGFLTWNNTDSCALVLL